MTNPSSGILDNKSLGSVVSELRKNIDSGCRLSIVSAFFSLYAYEDLKKELSKIENLRLLLPVSNDMAPFFGNLAGSHLDRRFRNHLDITRIARDCAAWLEKKCDVRQVASPIHQNLFHIDNSGKESQQVAIVGSSPFTTDGLGVVPSESHHMNTCFHDNEQAHGLLKWFDDLWQAGRENRDVKERLHQALSLIYSDKTPRQIYFLIVKDGRSASKKLQRLFGEKVFTNPKDEEILSYLFKAFEVDGDDIVLDFFAGSGTTFHAVVILNEEQESKCRCILVQLPENLREMHKTATGNAKKITKNAIDYLVR